MLPWLYALPLLPLTEPTQMHTSGPFCKKKKEKEKKIQMRSDQPKCTKCQT